MGVEPTNPNGRLLQRQMRLTSFATLLLFGGEGGNRTHLERLMKTVHCHNATSPLVPPAGLEPALTFVPPYQDGA